MRPMVRADPVAAPAARSAARRAADSIALIALLGQMALVPARAESLPRWEAGAGLTGLHFPDYRGSDQGRYFLLPFPFLVYRGDVVKVDRDGARARLLGTDRVEFDLSGGGSVPVHSSSNRARAGMPDLQPTLELGVVTQVHLWRGETGKVDVRVPVRRALAYSAGIIDAGTVAEVQLTYDHRLHWEHGGGEGNLGLLIGPVFADRRQNAYFYGVAAPYATAHRPAYQPGGGYGGWEAIGALSRRTGSWWFAGFVRYDHLGGAAFADSPLVLRRSQVAGGIGVAWVFAMSRERVEAAQ